VNAPSILSPAPPAFVLSDNVPVRSYCLGAWGGLIDGVTRVDSTNRPNGIVRLRYLKPAAFHQAVRLLLRRHTVLNARLEARDGAPWICPDSSADLNVQILDLGPRQTQEERADAERILGELVWEPFDYLAGPLYRAYAVKAGEEYYIGLVVHHFVADAMSISLLMRELTQLHDAVARRQIARLPPVQLRYQDYLRGIDAWIASDAGRKARRAVQRGLTGSAAAQFEATPPADDDHQYFIMDGAVVNRVRDTARRLGTSVFTVLLAAQNVVAAPRTATRSTTLKVITSGREVSSLMPVVGNMADRIYVATDVSGDPSFAELIMRTHASVNRCRKLAFVRADFVQADMNEVGLSTAAPVFNFRSARRHAPPTKPSTTDSAPPSLGVPPADVGQVTRPRDAYYLEIVDDGCDLWGSVKYGEGRIKHFLVTLEEVLRIGCQQTGIHLAELTRASSGGGHAVRHTIVDGTVAFGR
jgi:hypothetical protein